MTRNEALGWLIVVGLPLLACVLLVGWIVLAIPPVVWIALVVLGVALVFVRRAELREAWREAKRKDRVRVLRREIAKLEAERTGLKTHGYFRITPEEFKQELADLEQKLEVAEQDLRSIWKLSDRW